MNMPTFGLLPGNAADEALIRQVHPPDWQNPTPDGRYNLVVVGAGTAGLVTAAGAAGLGAKVALVERHLMGGDCLNIGCVPSKAILAASRVIRQIRQADSLGVHCEIQQIDFPGIMQRMRELRAGIGPHDSAHRFQKLGVDVFMGQGTFTAGDTVQVEGTDLTFSRAVVATGGRAAPLPIPGIEEIAPLTNESLFNLTSLPQTLTVIGGGPIGSEMAQAFALFGCHVTQIEKAPRILSREDPQAAETVQQAMRRDGVNIVLNATVQRFEKRGEASVTHYVVDGQPRECVSDRVLIGIGRAPNVEGLGLETAGVDFDLRRGVSVNDRMQTSNPKIFAAGDVASRYKFTHAADFQARMVIANALFMGRSRASGLTIPWTTYTSPELAHVGMTAGDAADAGIEIDTYTQEFDGVDRAILEGQTEGFARVHVRKGTDKIVGATVVAESAGDLISTLTMAMTHGLGLGKIGSTI
ncbi:MAG: mercuric reductase, partial [Planctomycetota bacterium]